MPEAELARVDECDRSIPRRETIRGTHWQKTPFGCLDLASRNPSWQRSCATATTDRTYDRKRSDSHEQTLATRGPSTYGSRLKAGTTEKSWTRAPNRRRLRCPLWCACQEQEKQVPKKMFYLETPPRLIETKIFALMPENFRRKGVRTEWADANRPGHPTDCFIEGPSFDAEGNLYIVDIPFGRIFRIAPGGQWTLAVEYEGWPNGLKISSEGRILVADYRHGIMELDAKAARMR